jgi:transcriptional regulator with XRE-family HTH domain
MGETRRQREERERRNRIADQQRAVRRAVGAELRRTRLDANVSLRALGRAIDLDPSHLARVEAGDRALSQDALVAAATALGRDVSVRLFESALVPHVRDRLQTQMIEALLAALHPRWMPRLEVAVYRPVRGVIDVVLQDREAQDLVAGEAHSLLHTVEGQLRWAGQKADALPSATGWPWADTIDPPRTGRLLLLRSCSALHDLVRAVPRAFAAAYPGGTEQAVAALTGPAGRWPSAAVAWVVIDGTDTRLLAGSPRAIRR